MRIAFRTDASARIGTGHVMRCLALAGALRTRGATVTFVCRDVAGHLGDAVARAGHGLALLPRPARPGSAGNGTAHADWLEVAAELDAAQTRAELERRGGVDWLVVDHYALDAVWLRQQRGAARRLLVLDDLADRALDADLLLDPLPSGPARYAARVPVGCGLLLGPHYALLRPEFAEARARVRPRDALRRLFVSFGGVDLTGETPKALEALAQLGDAAPAADIVVGGANAQAAAVREQCRALPRARFHQAAENVAELMAASDLALGAGGVMTWERASLGLPALVVPTAPNQEPGAAAIAAAGAGLALATTEATPQRIAGLLRELGAAPGRLRAMSEACLALGDGRGADRTARLLLAPPIVLRAATAADAGAVLAWRNDANVRRFFRNPAPVERATHERWFAAVLADPQRALLIAEAGGMPVAVLRYDVAGEVAETSIYLVPGQAGRGLGPAVLRAGADWLRERQPGVRTVTAQVLESNEASHRAFLAAGYRPRARGYALDLTR